MGDSKQPIRIAFVSHKFQRNDGQGRVNYEVVKAALARGYHVTLLATACAQDIVAHPNARFIPMGNASLPTAIARNLVFARTSARWLKQYRGEFDIIQTNGFVTWERCDISAAHFVHTSWIKSPYYPFTGYSPYAIYQRLFTRANSRWEKEVFTTAQRVIAVSKRIGLEIQALGVPPDRIDVIYNGVDTAQFHPGPPDRARFGLPSNILLALFVGDIRTPRKNLETVLKAMQRLPDLHLVVAGAMKGSRYPAMAHELGVGDRIIFLDKVAAMEALMQSVDLFVFPSRYEPFGLVVLEAMASGLPVIVSANSGIADYVGDGGLILDDPEDVQGLTTRLSDLLGSSTRRLAMGNAGRLCALQMQWSMMAEQYLHVYETFVQQGSSDQSAPA